MPTKNDTPFRIQNKVLIGKVSHRKKEMYCKRVLLNERICVDWFIFVRSRLSYFLPKSNDKVTKNIYSRTPDEAFPTFVIIKLDSTVSGFTYTCF